MKQHESASIEAWLQKDASLKELSREFPAEWEKVQHELALAFSSGKPSDVQAYLQRASKSRTNLQKKPHTLSSENAQRSALLELIRYQMARKAVQQHYVAIASGVESGTVKFNLFNGMLAQMLLFETDLVRKPVSMFWFRLLWPLVWQKRFLMPLVQPKGIYCFYSKELILALAARIGGKRCLEIAAGDGTLGRFLKNQGVAVTVTDDCSWHHAIKYPENVVRLDAKEALRRYEPEVLICSWPPAGNGFEKQIFVTKSIEMYIMLGSRHRFAAGNWEAYTVQTAFSFKEDQELSRLVVPPELDAAVYVFTRKFI